MSASDAMVARLRRMVNESTDDPYLDGDIAAYIETYPLIDTFGTDPWEVDFTTTPPTAGENSSWVPTYDLHAAAADIWSEKAAAIAEEFDFNADGGSFSRSQKYEQYLGKARYHQSRRSAHTVKLWVEPRVSPSEEEV